MSLKIPAILVAGLGIFLAACQAPRPETPPPRAMVAQQSPYSFRLVRPQESPNLRYEDMTISALFAFASAHGQAFNGINLSLRNNSPERIVIDWSKAKIIGLDGKSSEVTFTNAFVSETSFREDLARDQQVVAPGGTVNVTVYPVRNFRQTPSGHYIPAGMLPHHAEVTLEGLKVGLFMTFDAAGRKRYYTFQFQVEDART